MYQEEAYKAKAEIIESLYEAITKHVGNLTKDSPVYKGEIVCALLLATVTEISGPNTKEWMEELTKQGPPPLTPLFIQTLDDTTGQKLATFLLTLVKFLQVPSNG